MLRAGADFARARHSTQASTNAGTAQSIMPSQPGTMRDSIHAATARNSTPNRFLTVSIHAPARGSSFPADAPTNNKGVPMPRLIDEQRGAAAHDVAGLADDGERAR